MNMDFIKIGTEMLELQITGCDAFLSMPLCWKLNGDELEFSLIDLISAVNEDVVDNSTVAPHRWSQLIIDHTRSLNQETQALRKEQAEKEKQAQEKILKESIRKKQQDIMEHFKQIQTQFDFSGIDDAEEEEPERESHRDDTEYPTELPNTPRNGVQPLERKTTLEERSCVVCQANHNTKEDPLGMMARYQFSNHHGMPPLNRMSRAFQTSIFLRDLKKIVPNLSQGNQGENQLSSLSVTAALVDHDDLNLTVYNESCLFERSLNPEKDDKIHDSSFLDYLLPQKDYAQNCQSCAIVWWSCGHFMHRSCCRNHRRGSRDPRRGLNLGATVMELLAGAVEDLSDHGENAVEEYENLPTPSFGADSASSVSQQVLPSQVGMARSRSSSSPDYSSSSLGSPERLRESSDDEEYDRRSQLLKAGISEERFRERIEENVYNPYFSKQAITEPVCPYCSRRFNCLLINAGHSRDKPAVSPVNESLIQKDNVPFSSCYEYIHRKFLTIRNSIVLPPIFHAVTYRQTLAKLLLGNAQAVQKCPELIFNPEWMDISEVGCVISARHSLVAPSIPAHVCFEPPPRSRQGPTSQDSQQAFHVLQTHPSLTVADCIANILAVEELSMRRECRNQLSEIELEMVKRLHSLFLDSKTRLEQVFVSDPDPLRTQAITEDHAVSLGRSFLRKSPDALNGFDVVKYNILSCLLYGRTCYSPVDGSALGMPPDFEEANHAMIRSFSSNRSRWMWLTRALLVMDSETDETTRNTLLFEVCLLVFIMEYVDALCLFTSSHPKAVSSHAFTALLMEVLKTNWKMSPAHLMRDPFGSLNEIFAKQNASAAADIAGSETAPPVLSVCRPLSRPVYLPWEDSPEAMRRAAFFEVHAAKLFVEKIRRRELLNSGRRRSSLYREATPPGCSSDNPIQPKRRRTETAMDRNFEAWRQNDAYMGDRDCRSVTSLPDMTLHSSRPAACTHSEETLNLTFSPPPPPVVPPPPPRPVIEGQGLDLPTMETRVGHLEGLLRNVRDIMERMTHNLNGRLGEAPRGRDSRSLRPPLTERHQCEPLGGMTYTHKRRRGSFKHLPHDTTMRYAKFLAEQRETDLCRMTPERRRRGKKLYIQMLMDPLDIQMNPKFSPQPQDLQVDTLTKIALFGCLPFFRFLRLLTLSLNQKGSNKLELLQTNHPLFQLLGKSGCDKAMTERQLLASVQLLLMDTPLQSLTHMFAPKDGPNQKHFCSDFDPHQRFVEAVLHQTAAMLRTHWYMRYPRSVSLLKDDGSLMKNHSTLISPFIVVKNATAESVAFSVEQQCFHSVHLLHMLKRYSGDPELSRFLFWYTNPLLTPNSPKAYKSYVNGMYEKPGESSADSAMAVFTSYLSLPNQARSKLEYSIHLRLWIPYFVNLPSEYSLFFHSQLQKM
eukprot:Gregarina_sp_Poly_1__7722@NODE_435_length_8451_cov_37_257514_g355_i0_p1_GENE_NODE_435_length_8451_cov_37_257514_g355_i0NODE_435_length_8451_cov_37_257514_g355_i0_p1_ORF_typecomplete_len1399_score231_55RPN7/PF10602_9/2_9RPN7/PF10602_9/8_4e03zfANAPC11/PF12861_7/6_5e03zfANAPC11/PF12861_7/0_84zfANAPC11/PF12861_7/2_7e03ArmDNAbind_5/PF17293_2/1_7ArmDNAbind_5/PF17293_2/1_1e04_NODE_435_length_8451_cov_37_257514_g355_i018686064